MKKGLIKYIIIALIIIAGIIVWKVAGFNKELNYSTRQEIEFSRNEGIDISDVKQMASEILKNRRFYVQQIETFDNSVQIVADSISEEERNEFVKKFNEKYSTELKNEDVIIKTIPSTKVIDIVKPVNGVSKFILPGITMLIVLIYILVRYKELDWKKVLLQIVFVPIVVELLWFSILSITRIPFGRVTISIGAVLYLLIILVLTNIFEDRRNKNLENTQSKNN